MLHMLERLEHLQDQLLTMADRVTKALEGSVRVLANRDELQARRVLDYEDDINALEMDIDQLATELLALNQPVAKDLRFITAAIKINSDLERMGDLAVNIARSSLDLLKSKAEIDITDIQAMAYRVQDMLKDAVKSIETADAERARSVLVADDAVDDIKNRLFAKLVHGIEENAQAAASNVDLIFIAHSLERIADHATNIAEDVLFFVKGMDVRHHHVMEH
jgi:phosphate transport system protein